MARVPEVPFNLVWNLLSIDQEAVASYLMQRAVNFRSIPGQGLSVSRHGPGGMVGGATGHRDTGHNSS
jgi:hypothetical protein